MKQYKRGEIVVCPRCGEFPDGCDYPAEDYFVPPAKPRAYEEIECGNCYTLIECEVSSCGDHFLFRVGE